MNRLFTICFLMFTICLTTFAQDVIVKKDGSTIQAKVLKVSSSEVEYKKFDNQNGPTYTVSTKELQCINYENGTSDKFVSENYNPNIVTNETATHYSNDQKLLKMYGSTDYKKKARTLKIIGWSVGGTLLGTAIALAVYDGVSSGNETYLIDGGGFICGSICAAAGIATWAGCYFSAKNLEKKSQYSVQSSPLYKHEFNIGKTERLMVGVDIFKDNTYKHQTLGLGLAYNF